MQRETQAVHTNGRPFGWAVTSPRDMLSAALVDLLLLLAAGTATSGRREADAAEVVGTGTVDGACLKIG